MGTRLLASALGYAYALSGCTTEGVTLLEEAVRETAALGVFFRYALWLSWLGEAHLLAGQLDQASSYARQALADANARKERGHQAHALRLLGEIAARHGAREAERCGGYYAEALALTEELGMRPLQARCRLGLGKLCHRTGRADEARAELSTAVAMLREMGMEYWLPEAERELAEASR